MRNPNIIIDTNKPITTIAQAKVILTKDDVIEIAKVVNRGVESVRSVLKGIVSPGMTVSFIITFAEEKRKKLLEKAKLLVEEGY